MVYPYNGILVGHKKKWSTDSCYMDKPWKYYASARSQTQKSTHCMIPLLWNVHRQIHRDRKTGDFQGMRGGVNGEWQLIIQGFLLADKVFWN